MGMTRKLGEEDLKFIVRTVATHRQDYEHIQDIVRDKDDLLEIMLEDDKLFQQVMEEQAWLHISPYLLFTILLRQTRKDIGRERYTLERLSPSQRLPVFDTWRVASLLEDQEIRDYLADMLASFTRTETAVVYRRSRGRVYRRCFSDMDIDDMMELAQQMKEEHRLRFYKRIGDIALFLVGIFPESVLAQSPFSAGEARPKLVGRKQRSLEEYEEEGGNFYRLAAEQAAARETELGELLLKLADNFALAKKPLNFLAERYIPFYRFQWFSPSP